ncbi:hypothetical protein FE257_002179 [Aspergillus nanangensis]|uniref:Uncharacterized protein n=1 Tax=Aspergillus nanangensis TaxID=2582783 RepID=A0AAD4GQA6_ASPNN|nr:hypothetical protein FE257_002179 [Aspergillus nanangensis]
MFAGRFASCFVLLLSIAFFTKGDATLAAPSKGAVLGTILTKINTVADDYVVFHESITVFDGSPETLATIQKQERTIEKHLQDTIMTAEVSPHLNKTGSKQIMRALEKPYPTFMSDLLDNITYKEPIFKKTGSKRMVLDWLKCLYSLSNELPMALEKITVKSDADQIESGRKWSNALFTKSLAVYEG